MPSSLLELVKLCLCVLCPKSFALEGWRFSKRASAVHGVYYLVQNGGGGASSVINSVATALCLLRTSTRPGGDNVDEEVVLCAESCVAMERLRDCEAAIDKAVSGGAKWLVSCNGCASVEDVRCSCVYNVLLRGKDWV